MKSQRGVVLPILVKPVWKPRSTYTIVGEAVRVVLPTHVLCSMCCGGQTCKYEGPSQWSEDDQAVKGLYSSWVTDNLLAMARPSTKLMEKYNIIDQFKRFGVKTVINLQRPGEHGSCGDPLEPDSGFTYRPEVLMENDIYFYNFGWDDYGVVSQWAMLDMMKVMTFAMEEGKMAVHCHAGLGRTGVLIACFLIHATRMTADEAILYVRDKRPNSIQTRGQLWCVREFAKFLVPFRRVFSFAEPWTAPVTLSQYLTRQSHLLHGYERRQLRHLPKILHLVCRLLLDIAENRQVIEEDILEVPDITTEAEMSVRRCPGKFAPDKDRPRLPGRQPPPRHHNEPPIFYHRKALSYSDSDLQRLGNELNLLQAPPLTSLSQSNVLEACGDSKASLAESISSVCSTGSLWEKKLVNSPILKKLREKTAERIDSQNFPKRISFFNRVKISPSAEVIAVGKEPQRKEEEEERSEVPVLTIQTELSLEAKRLLVAQALAVDLQQEGESEHKHRISVWQGELNLQGAWERLCMERDPFVLSALMWLWLEQLREPVISPRAAQSLVPNEDQPQTALRSLDQGPRQCLVCILDCMAHVLSIPETVEAAFLDRIIKAFTQLEKSSVVGKEVYKTLTEILRPILHEMRQIAVEQDQMKQLPYIPVYPLP